MATPLPSLPPELLHLHLLPLLSPRDLLATALSCHSLWEKVVNFLASHCKVLTMAASPPLLCTAREASQLRSLLRSTIHPSLLAPVLHLFLSFSPVTQLAFATHNLSVLRHLHLSEPTIFDNERVQDILMDTVRRNLKLEMVVLDVKFISVDLVSLLAWHCPSLKMVQLDSMNIYYWDAEGEKRRVWPCTCWGAIPCDRLRSPPRPDYASVDFAEDPNEEMLERKLLCCLRKLCKCCSFQDLSPLSPSPLALHEVKCRRGLFYDGTASDEEEGLVGEINLMNQMEEEMWWSSTSSESSSSPSLSPQPHDIGQQGNSSS